MSLYVQIDTEFDLFIRKTCSHVVEKCMFFNYYITIYYTIKFLIITIYPVLLYEKIDTDPTLIIFPYSCLESP